MVNIAINGFGRIGRCAFKIALDRRDTEIVAINNRSGSPELFSHLIKYDTIYGIYNREVSFDKNNIIIDGKPIRFFNESDPTNLPWKELDVDVVLECTGAFTDPAKAKAHLKSGAKKVVISAPAKGEGAKTIVIGANDYELTEDDKIISCASCTTNCIAPVMKVLEDKIGIKKAMMTTVHSYTPSQSLSDSPSKSFRLSRAATENIIPSTTGASKTTALTIPSLTNKFDGLSIRVPTPTVSLCDLVAVLKVILGNDNHGRHRVVDSGSSHFVNDSKIRFWVDGGADNHQHVDIGERRALKLVFARKNLLKRTESIIGNRDFHPVADNGSVAALAEAAARLALIFLILTADVIESADGFHQEPLPLRHL